MNVELKIPDLKARDAALREEANAPLGEIPVRRGVDELDRTGDAETP